MFENLKYTVASSIGFYELSRRDDHVVLAPVRAIYDFPEDTPDFVTVFEDRVELTFSAKRVTVQQDLPRRELDSQVDCWVFDFAQERHARGQAHKLKAWEPLRPCALLA